jgi:multidrug efflux pump subunit AcrB
MLSGIAVFAPSFFMAGVPRAMFVPLAFAVAFSMIFSYLLAGTVVPIMEVWLNQRRRAGGVAEESSPWFDRFRGRFGSLSRRLIEYRWLIVSMYLLAALGTAALAGRAPGTEIFPQVDTGVIQMRLRAPTGTGSSAPKLTQEVLTEIRDRWATPISRAPWLSSVLTSLLSSQSHLSLDHSPERSGPAGRHKPRHRNIAAGLQIVAPRIPEIAPGVNVSFEAADLVSQVMSFGAPTPVEIAVTGPRLTANRKYAESIVSQLRPLDTLRDVQLGELLDYPTVDIRVDRERAGQLGVSVSEIGRALGPSTWSSRFTTPIYWADPESGIAYQIQVEVPQSRMTSMDDLRRIPVKNHGAAATLLGDVADLSYGKMFGEYHRLNMQRIVTVTANIHGRDLAGAASRISTVLRNLPPPPPGVAVTVRGQIAPLRLMMQNLWLGLSLSIIAVFILLAAYFQSLRVAAVILLAIPAVLAGVALALLLTGTTWSLQSFMGAMMAVGISVANTILLCTFADHARRSGVPAGEAAVQAAQIRMRPVLMTSSVMIAGMLPLAFGSAQTAPLGSPLSAD